MTTKNNYIPVIGLEIHVELKTKSKMFCQCSANYFGKKPNTNTCPVCLGLPGALPVPNKKAVAWTILLGKALNCKINQLTKFDRKHYFYPDLPKGYQISQYDEPIAIDGQLKIHPPNRRAMFKIRRVHLEEDTGKLIHKGNETLIDFNRSGVPLVEIVTEPDFDNADDVKRFLEELQVIVRYLGISDADMEKGSMRLEPNISIKQVQSSKLKVQSYSSKLKVDELPDYKVEVKNINSFRFVKQAIDYEIKRQIAILEKGGKPLQETRGFDEKKMITFSQRVKEEAQDYRYFPEPDIPPMTFSQEFLEKIMVPELPEQKLERFIKDFGLKPQDAFLLTRDKNLADFFEKTLSKVKMIIFQKQVSIENSGQFLANIIINKKISLNIPIEEFVEKVVKLMTPKETDEKLLEQVFTEVIASYKKVVADYQSGKQNALMFLVGQVMKRMKGKADGKIIISKLKSRILKQDPKS
jgi:aspartyl-tRNA(Asn)/glutamyl-tRNA(Gln) amidotransferase subunit B